LKEYPPALCEAIGRGLAARVFLRFGARGAAQESWPIDDEVVQFYQALDGYGENEIAGDFAREARFHRVKTQNQQWVSEMRQWERDARTTERRRRCRIGEQEE